MPWLNSQLKRKGRMLYKELVHVSKHHYPLDKRKVINRIKSEFSAYSECDDEKEVKRALANGRWRLKEMYTASSISKYRWIKRNYYDEQDTTTLDDPTSADSPAPSSSSSPTSSSSDPKN